MKLADLDDGQLRERLSGDGLYFHTGPFINALRSHLPDVLRGLRLVYNDYRIAERHDYADFHVTLASPRSLRRWYRPQVQFYFDGMAPFKPLPRAQAFPMLEWGLNWCVGNHCHQYLIIHAAVLEKHGQVLILPGAPGAGKSTLCAGLTFRGGWRLLSDELTLLRLSDGQVQPLPRPVSLKNASIAVIKAYAPEVVFTPSAFDTAKGTVAHACPPRDSVAREAQTAPPAWVVFPRYLAGASTALTRISRADAYLRLVDQAFNYSLLGMTGFEALSRLMDSIDSFAFQYSQLDEALGLFERLAAGESRPLEPVL